MAKVHQSAGRIVAKMVSDSSVLDEAVEKIRAKAEANASAHRKTGKYSGNFTTGKAPGKYGVVDRFVINATPGAAPIEYGHYTKDKDGSLKEWVPGQFNLLRAAGIAYES